ncbi:MAG: glycerol kinase GlpK [bacterium]|nr:glycerol kinase GlpK [bacterium]
MSRCILALDQGTTSSRALVVGHDGQIISVAQKEFPQHFPRPGWVEQDPQDIWNSQLAVARSALRKAKIAASEVAAIGITNQRETTIVWDRVSGEPVYNAIVWQDRRTADFCARFKTGKWAEVIKERTGLIVDPYFSGTKIAWILDNVPDARSLARQGRLAFGTVDSWLLWKFTGGEKAAQPVLKTDLTNASRTMLCDIGKEAWDAELAKALKIPMSLLPEICSSSEVYCESEKKLLGASIPIAGIAGDQHAALFGQMCFRPGMVKNTYGTGCFMLMNTGRKRYPSHNNLLSTTGWKLGKQKSEYALEGSIFIAGAVVQWLRDGLGIIKRSADVERLAAKVADHGGVYLVPAFAGLGAPHWDAYARGTIVGVTRGTTAAHLARAALDSIAYQTADVLEAMRADSGLKIASLLVDGGAAGNDLLMQFQADILGVPVVRPKVFESTGLGASYLAGLAVGFWKDIQELAGQWQIDRTFEPQLPRAEALELRAGWTKALQRAKGWEG